MTVLLDDGPFRLTQGSDQLNFSASLIKGDLELDPKFTLYPNGGFARDQGKLGVPIKLTDLMFSTQANYETFLDTLFNPTTGWQTQGNITLTVFIDVAHTIYFKLDGTHNNYTGLVQTVQGTGKSGKGDDTNYGIDMLVFKAVTRS